MIESWVLVTLLYSPISALYAMTNDVFRQDGKVAVFWRSLFSTIVLLPFGFFIDWPTDTGFYIVAIGASCLYAIGDIVMFQAFKHHGGAAISRLNGFRPMILFFLWPIFAPHSIDAMIQAPLTTVGIFLCLTFSATVLYYGRHNPVSRAAFFAYLPCLLIYNLGDIGMKFAAPDGSSWDRAIIFTLILSAVMTFCTGTLMATRDRRIIVPERVFFTGAINAALFLVLCIVKVLGISLSPNPAYFNALALISVLWTYLLHRYALKKEDKASPIAGFAVVAAAAILTILVEMLPK